MYHPVTVNSQEMNYKRIQQQRSSWSSFSGHFNSRYLLQEMYILETVCHVQCLGSSLFFPSMQGTDRSVLQRLLWWLCTSEIIAVQFTLSKNVHLAHSFSSQISCMHLLTHLCCNKKEEALPLPFSNTLSHFRPCQERIYQMKVRIVFQKIINV